MHDEPGLRAGLFAFRGTAEEASRKLPQIRLTGGYIRIYHSLYQPPAAAAGARSPMLDQSSLRTIDIPECRVAQRLIDARHRRYGDAYDCVVCGLPIPKPKLFCHVIDGGGVALHVDDEHLYVADAGDLGCQPIGSDCLRRHPEMKPYVFKDAASSALVA